MEPARFKTRWVALEDVSRDRYQQGASDVIKESTRQDKARIILSPEKYWIPFVGTHMNMEITNIMLG